MGFIILVMASCSDDDGITSIGGEQSPMGEVGARLETPARPFGVSNVNAEVVELNDGVSTFSGSARISNPVITNILSNAPHVVIVDDEVHVTDIEVSVTTEGIKSVRGLLPGVIVQYDAQVGDTYPIPGKSGSREVTYRSEDNDYYWGGMYIRVIEVVEPTNSRGVKNTTYYANHRWGMVGIEFELDDGTMLDFPLDTRVKK